MRLTIAVEVPESFPSKLGEALARTVVDVYNEEVRLAAARAAARLNAPFTVMPQVEFVSWATT